MGHCNRITIVGLGCIGGSLGLALRRQRSAHDVVGLSRRAATIQRAVQLGAIAWGTTDLAEGVRDADLVVLATPVGAIVPLAKRLSRLMKPGAVLTDVGSSKGAIVSSLERWCHRRGTPFVGGHPLAGSDQQGIEAAQRDLFDGSICLLTRTPHTDAKALALVQRLWRPLVGRLLVLSPKEHDRHLSAVSHVPHAIAFALTVAASPRARAVAPRSFLEATRVAKSDAVLWRDILLSNRAAVRADLRAVQRRLAAIDRWLLRCDATALMRFLRHARAIRAALD